MHINLVDILILAVFFVPIAVGVAYGFTRSRLQRSFAALLENIGFVGGIILAIYLTGRIFYNPGTGLFKDIHDLVAIHLMEYLTGRDMLIYMLSVSVLLLIIIGIVRLITAPLYKWLILPFSERIFGMINASNAFVRRFIAGVWEVPRSILFVLLISLLLYYSSYFIYSPGFGKYLTDSAIYGFIYDNALNSMLSSNLVQKIPVLDNDSFKDVVERLIPSTSNRVRITEYFNGMTLEDAVVSNDEIDGTALAITEGNNDDKGKAYCIYSWITENIRYDYDKAEKIAADPSGILSGSIVAFSVKKGVCFDYSCLFVSMCRAVGLKTRLVTGLGYSGNEWGDHAWNQVYCGIEQRWIDVDTTFGSTGLNYFDKRNFMSDHKYADVQGEW